jgi:Zn-dependent alcohol dehydrogenase
MVVERRLEVQSLISKKYRFEDINEALEDLRQGRLLMGISLWN